MNTPDPHSCPTCADHADLVEVVCIRGADATVLANDGSEFTAAVDLIENVAPGDRILVHQGVAISRAADQSAARPAGVPASQEGAR